MEFTALTWTELLLKTVSVFLPVVLTAVLLQTLFTWIAAAWLTMTNILFEVVSFTGFVILCVVATAFFPTPNQKYHFQNHPKQPKLLRVDEGYVNPVNNLVVK